MDERRLYASENTLGVSAYFHNRLRFLCSRIGQGGCIFVCRVKFMLSRAVCL